MWAAVLVISTVLVNVVPRDDAREICGDGAWGCTKVQGGLVGWCVESSKGWSVRTAVKIEPVMYLSSRLLEDHERRHLADLQMQVRQFQAEASAPVFPSEDRCLAAADRARMLFPGRLKSFVDRSNVRLR